jgi:hypothetical protein
MNDSDQQEDAKMIRVMSWGAGGLSVVTVALITFVNSAF